MTSRAKISWEGDRSAAGNGGREMSVHRKFWLGTNLQSRRWLIDQRLEAVEQNDLENLRELLSNQRPVNAKELQSALQKAVLKKTDDYAECVDLLLQKGAAPLGMSGTGAPILLVAAEAGCPQVLQLLIQAKGDINQANRDGCTCLHRAIVGDQLECVKMLLDAGADTMIQDKRGETPFLSAARLCRIEVMEMLLEAGCDPAIPDNRQCGVLHHLALNNLAEVMDFLLEEDKDMIEQINLQNLEGQTALMLAAENGNAECLEILLRYGADVEIRNKDNETAFVIASRSFQFTCAQMLAAAGCEINVLSNEGIHPIIWLCKDPQCLKFILEAGADPNGCDSIGHILLTHVYKCPQSLKILLQYNCRYNCYLFRNLFKQSLLQGLFLSAKILLYAAVLMGISISWIKEYINSSQDLSPTIKSWVEKQVDLYPSLPKLSVLCRSCIRQSMPGVNFAKNISFLPLPRTIISDLLLPELMSFNPHEE